MSKLLICPDCGGEIGGDGKSGHAPCRCALEQFSDFSTASDSGVSQALQAAPAGGEPEKLCNVCGKNLKGHRRWKRDAGYICATCREFEKTGVAPPDPDDDRETCSDCGKKLKPAGMVDYEGLRICRTCHASRKELDKHKPKLIHNTHHDAHEMQKIKLAAVVVATIGLILLVKWAFGL